MKECLEDTLRDQRTHSWLKNEPLEDVFIFPIENGDVIPAIAM